MEAAYTRRMDAENDFQSHQLIPFTSRAEKTAKTLRRCPRLFRLWADIIHLQARHRLRDQECDQLHTAVRNFERDGSLRSFATGGRGHKLQRRLLRALGLHHSEG